MRNRRDLVSDTHGHYCEDEWAAPGDEEVVFEETLAVAHLSSHHQVEIASYAKVPQHQCICPKLHH